MRLWQADLELPPVEIEEEVLYTGFKDEGFESVFREHPDKTLSELLRYYLNSCHWVYNEDEFEQFYLWVLENGDVG